jgi:hypothetical protein
MFKLREVGATWTASLPSFGRRISNAPKMSLLVNHRDESRIRQETGIYPLKSPRLIERIMRAKVTFVSSFALTRD